MLSFCYKFRGRHACVLFENAEKIRRVGSISHNLMYGLEPGQVDEQRMKDRTTIVIAHRLSTIVNANKIIVQNCCKPISCIRSLPSSNL